MRGFFSKKTVEEKHADKSCSDCMLYKSCISPKMQHTGKGKLKTLIVAETPEKKEDEKGVQLIGDAGQLLRRTLKKFGYDLDNDFWKTNAIICRPPNNRKPTRKELKLCRKNLMKTIEELKPNFIFLLGGVAIEAMYMERFSGLSISRWRRLCIPDKVTNAWVLPMYHPSYVNRMDHDENLRITFENDVKWALSCLKKKKPKFEDFESQVKLLTEKQDILNTLEHILKSQDLIAFDYETTGLKPFTKGHTVLSIGIACEYGCFAFPYRYYDDQEIYTAWRNILRSKDIRKACHNCLKGRTKILMEDGSFECISTIVNKKINKKVMCYDNKGNLTSRKIINYFLNRHSADYWYTIAIKTKKNKGNYPKLTCTEHHEIYTQRGKVRADELRKDDKLLYMGGANKDFEDLLIGSFLGDGGFTKIGDCHYISFGHSLAQKEYLENIQRYANDCGFETSSIKKDTKFEVCTFRVKATPYFRELFNKLNIENCLSHLSLKSLTKWYLDDGTLTTFDRKKGKTYSVHIKCKRFTKEEREKASVAINKIIGRNCCKALKAELSIGTKHAPIFLKKIAPYANIGGECMRYKNPFSESTSYKWDVSKKYFHIGIESIKYKKINKKQSNYTNSYDIEVEEYHNYIAEGIKVSNSKFEGMWSRQVFDTKIFNVHWCTMNAAHILDDRQGFTGLKFQAYINFGIEGYDAESKKYIKSVENGFNNLHKMPLNKLLLYNGLDALLTLKLYQKQKKILLRKRDSRCSAFKLTMKGLTTMLDLQMRGINVDELYYTEQNRCLTKKIKDIEKELENTKDAKRFKIKIGRKINPRSSKDLKELFYNVLNLKPPKVTDKGTPSVDHEAIEQINSEYGKKLIELRKIEKIKGTYLAQFEREIVDGKLHPFFDLHTTRSYRSSSSAPNFQNLPNRSEEAKIIRDGILPSRGNKILCIDYGSMEVRIIACYSHDPVLMDYINNPNSDMHRDMAKLLFSLTNDQVTKLLRFHAKNGWTFAQFYGAYYKSCAKSIWSAISGLKTGDEVDIYQHLKNKKIIRNAKDFPSFELSMKKCEQKFWDRFKKTREWQEESVKKYQKDSYIQLYTGYRRSGYLTRNMIFNTPIQGAAFHCLLWSAIELNKVLQRRFSSKIIAQIHDELVIDLVPEEQDEVLKIAKQIMTGDIVKVFPWIVVPLVIEAEVTPIDGCWTRKEEVRL